MADCLVCYDMLWLATIWHSVCLSVCLSTPPRTYDFPPSLTLLKGQDGHPESHDGRLETKDEAIVRELQTSRLEKEQILEYENYLASASKTAITEKNSLMLNQVTLFDPR